MTAELYSQELSPELAEALDALLCAVRAEIDGAALLEHRAAALGALLVKASPRYLARATSEMSEAFGALEDAGETRRYAVARAGTALGLPSDSTLAEFAAQAPFPYGAALAANRAELVSARGRLLRLTEVNTSALGQRLALVEQALHGVGDDSNSTYGRVGAAPPRIVRGVL